MHGLNTIERQKIARDLLEAAGFAITESSDNDGWELTAVSEAGATYSGLSNLEAVERAIREDHEAAESGGAIARQDNRETARRMMGDGFAHLSPDQAVALIDAYNVLMDSPDARDTLRTWDAEDREALSAAYGNLLIATGREEVARKV